MKSDGENTMDNKAFNFKRIAQGYKERPFLHKNVIELFKKDFCDFYFEKGLDVGCGAGLSTKALKLICSEVTGVDISEEMINVAREVCEGSGFDFFVSKAEEIPSRNHNYDIVTAAGVIQWVDRTLFLKNLNHVMNENGILLIYDFWITNRMKLSDDFTNWWDQNYLLNYPKPFRNEEIWKQEEVKTEGFTLLKQNEFDLEFEFDLDGFIKFMLIQSNVNAKIEGEGKKLEEVKEWFYESLKPIFKNEKKILIFHGYSWYLKKGEYDVTIGKSFSGPNRKSEFTTG